MNVIYSPKGRAQEYAESTKGAGDGLALNIFRGCPHRCAYCYVPLMPPWLYQGPNAKEEFHKAPAPRVDIVRNVERDSKNATEQQKQSPLHLCFTCDPYPPRYNTVTREVLLALEAGGWKKVQILTKGGMSAVRDFDIMERNDWSFGSTIVSCDDLWLSYAAEGTNELYGPDHPCENRLGIEPYAACFSDRQAALQIAHDQGIRTWVSLEPVLRTKDALEVIDRMKPWVDFWRIGKLNHGARISAELGEMEKEADWKQFVVDAKELLQGSDYMFKDSLKEFSDE